MGDCHRFAFHKKEVFFMIKAIAKLVLVFNSNVSKTQVAAGIAWGVMLGLVPVGNFFWIVLFLASFFFTIHHGMKLVFMALLIVLSPLFRPLLDILGWEVLHLEPLRPIFTTMYNMPFVPFTRFNNTLVAGGVVAGLALFFPLFFLLLPLIYLFRQKLSPLIGNSKLVQAVLKIPFFSAIDKAIAGMADRA